MHKPNIAAEPVQEKQETIQAPEIKADASSPDSPAAPVEEKKPLTVLELKTGNVYLPKLFFTHKASPVQFGIVIHGFLRALGMGTPHEDAVVVPGYLWASEMFSPVEIAVASYLYYNAQASAKEIGKQRKLPKGLVERTLAALEELGMYTIVSYGSDRIRKPATLEDFIGGD